MKRELDALTGLYKEDWLKQGLYDELNRAERFERDLGILLIEPIIPADLVRDLSYPVLKKLGNVSRNVFRVVDVGVRLKNRLLYLLPETSSEGVEVATKKLSEKFSEAEFVHSSTGEKFSGKFKSVFYVFPSIMKDREDVVGRLTADLEAIDE